jgi:small-conductance mechanosensitive channel
LFREAKVSRTFLYDDAQAPLLERLRAVANAQPGSGRPALPENQRVSTKSHEAIVRTLRAANQKLRQDNNRLANELAVALGQLRDLRRGLLAAYLSRHGPMINGNAFHARATPGSCQDREEIRGIPMPGWSHEPRAARNAGGP